MRKRRFLGTDEDRKAVKVLLKKGQPSWATSRLIALSMGFDSAHSLAGIAEVVGVDVATIKRWLSTYRKEGLKGLLNRGYGIGRPSQLDEEIESFLLGGLKAARWNTAIQAQQDLEKHFGREFNYKTVWVWLKKCAGVLRIPRPVHEKRDSLRAETFKRHFLGILKQQPVSGRRPVKVWFADESRYGLLPVHRRCWTQKGLRPQKRWQTRYDWSYCYGALDVVEGKTIFLQTPTVNLQWTEAFLDQIKKQYPEHEHIVVWDGAGFHPKESFHERVPEGIYIVLLPPYSPELNPIERLWDLIQDQTSNKLWPSIKRLDQVVAEHLREWWENPNRVIQLVGKGWIRSSANATSNP